MLSETWTSVSGSTGTAMMFYDDKLDMWRRIWRSGGHHIELSGGRTESGTMLLTGEAQHYASGEIFPLRGW